VAKQQFGLGKGLGALIPDPVPLALGPQGGAEEARDGILRLPLHRLKPNPDQPRKSFSEESLSELAESIKRHGLIQPILAEDAGDGTFVIVAGERRYRAAERAGLRELPVILRELTPEKRLELAIIENVQREDLNPIDEAEAYRSLMGLGNLSQDQVADVVSKSRPSVANSLRLLRLPEPMRAALRDGSMTAGHARALLAVSDPVRRELLFARVVAEGISVREAEAAAQALERGLASKPAAARKTGKPRDPEIREIEERLIGELGTKVSVRGDSRSGSVAIEYYSLEDLERILDVICHHSA
jgi:ParB family chromosome partitioning protein